MDKEPPLILYIKKKSCQNTDTAKWFDSWKKISKENNPLLARIGTASNYREKRKTKREGTNYS